MIEAGRLMEYGTYAKLTLSRTSRLNVFLISRQAEEVEEAEKSLSRNTSNVHHHPPPQLSRSASKTSADWPSYSRSRCSSERTPGCLPADLAESEFPALFYKAVYLV
ncbi:unnamed protein product [Dibothriocephalus latus]|uniref:Uncharacterized protein n=1 Tax=Dibothriocephalus latus TaxID=60516 RepID=A0A3P7N926_DIBLA|nr:unnamed protein product [Dibothriocephalus latus]